jgi:hypothetical protein
MRFSHSGAQHILCCVFALFSSSSVTYIALFPALSIIDYPFGTNPASLKLTYISYRWRFSFISFACIVRSFFVFCSFAFRSCNWFVCFVHRSFRSSL